MNKIVIILIIALIPKLSQGQFIKEKSINGQIGYGLSSPYYSIAEVGDSGFFAQGELVLKSKSWLELRPYAGFILTNSDGKDLNDNPTEERAESKAFLLGGKARLRAPIPWVAPYVEIGIGTSIGKFETQTFYSNLDKAGLVYHIPYSFGLELGKHHNVDLGFAFYAQPSVEQILGAFTVGITVPLQS